MINAVCCLLPNKMDSINFKDRRALWPPMARRRETEKYILRHIYRHFVMKFLNDQQLIWLLRKSGLYVLFLLLKLNLRVKCFLLNQQRRI